MTKKGLGIRDNSMRKIGPYTFKWLISQTRIQRQEMTTTYGGFEHYTVKTQKLLALNHDDMCPHFLSEHAAIHAPCAIQHGNP